MRAKTISYEGVFRKEIISNKVATYAMGVTTFVLLTTLGAYAKIYLPFTPVPITLQTLFVLLSGAILGRNFGALSQAIYILLGCIGIPVFANYGSGFSYLLGPTGGYLIGFVFASYISGMLFSYKSKNFLKIIAVMIFSTIIIYTLGLIQLNNWCKCGWEKTFQMGFVPFISGDIAKLIFAGIIFGKYQIRIREIFK